MGDSQTITTPDDHYRRGAELLAAADNRASDPVASHTMATLANSHFAAATAAASLTTMRDAGHYMRAEAERAERAAHPLRVANAQGWDPTSPQHAVIRAAIAWRKGIGADPESWATEDDVALIKAVDELPFCGDQTNTDQEA